MLSAFLRLLILIAAGFIISQIAAFAIIAGSGVNISEAGISNLPALSMKVILLLSHLFTFILPCGIFIFLNYKEEKWSLTRLNKGFDLNSLVLCIILVVVTYPAVTYSYTVNSWIPLADWMINQETSTAATLEKILTMDSIGVLFFNIFLIALIPAIGEELLFRGLLMDFMERSKLNIHKAIWISALAFSLFHLQFQGFLPRFLLGALLGYSYYFTRSLWVPIILHFLNNATPIIALYFFGNDLASIDPTEATEIHWLTGLTSLIIGILVAYYIYNKRKVNELS